MKKLNITKEQFNRSKYFQNKYGKLEYVSESGEVYKTSKGKLIRFNESIDKSYKDEMYNFVEEGSLDAKTLALELIDWMDESDLERFCEVNGYEIFEDEDL